jgi:cupin fold WbuC family metalloprotein
MASNESKASFPRALPAPDGDVNRIDSALLDRVAEMARKSPRGRIIMPFHKRDDEGLQRMLNALQPYSYVTPHRHIDPPKAESVVALRGSVGFVTFSDSGEPQECDVLAVGTPLVGIDVEAGLYHTFFALKPDTVVFEAKPGPYYALSDKAFAPWAPREGGEGAREYLERLMALVAPRSE